MLSIFGAVARRVPRSVALVGVTAVTAGTVLVLGPSDLVLAHTPSVGATCSGLQVTLSSYEGNPSNNRLTVTIDGAAQTFNFGSSLSKFFSWSDNVDHSYSWSVDANRNSGDTTRYDTGGSGSKDACHPPATTTTTVAPTTTTVALTTTTTVVSHKVWICHTPPGNPNNPQILHVDANGWNGHDGHPDDKGPFAAEQEAMAACAPHQTTTTTVAPTTTTVAPTTSTIASTTTTVVSHKVWICHTPPGNPNNPQVIEVDANGWNGHDDQTDDQGPFATEQEAIAACSPRETTTTTTIPETTTTVAETTTTVAETTTTTTIPETTTTVADTTSTTVPETTTTVVETTTTTTTIPEPTTTVAETTTTTEPLVPTLRFDVLTPVCDNDAPYLDYSIEVTGTPITTASINFVNPFGNDVVYFNLPLSGRVLWPGAAVDSNGTPTDWPGWTRLADGSWQAGDAFDWARSSLQVIAVVNPIGTAVVSYPSATPGCAANPTGVDAVTENNDPGVAPQTANPALLLPQTA